jgi:site-specific DNA-cytosine methylase
MKALAIHGLGGGFAYGVQQSGVDLAGQVETTFGQKIRNLNIDPASLISWDASNLDRALLKHAQADLLFGCPPCAGFSVAGSGLAQHDNPSHPINNGIRDWFYAVEKAQPMIAVLESVPRTFFSPAGQDLWQPLVTAHLAGYGITFVTYDNQQLGVPQKRVRTLMWAMKGGSPDVQLDHVPPVTWTKHHIGDLGTPTVGWEVDEAGWGHNVRPIGSSAPDWVMRFVPWGGNARKTAEEWLIWEELVKRGRQRPSFLWRRLHPHRAAPVLLADAGERIAHYEGEETGAGDSLRYLSGREVARLMGYPDSFKLAGHLRRDVGPSLCQAVSPAVGRWVGTEAGRLLEEADPYLSVLVGSETTIHYVDLTSGIVAIEPPTMVQLHRD